MDNFQSLRGLMNKRKDKMKKRRSIEINEEIISVLNVPFPKEEQGNFWYCFPFSVKIVIDFYRRTDPYLQKIVPDITIPDMIQRLNVHPLSRIKLSAKKFPN